MKSTETTERLLQSRAQAIALRNKLESRYGSGLVVSIGSYGSGKEDLREDVAPACIRAEDAKDLLIALIDTLDSALNVREESLERQLQEIRGRK